MKIEISTIQKKIIFILFQCLFSWFIITKNIIPFSFFWIEETNNKDIITLITSFLPSIILGFFRLIESFYITLLAYLWDYRVKKWQYMLWIKNYNKILSIESKYRILNENQINIVKNAKEYAQSKVNSDDNKIIINRK